MPDLSEVEDALCDAILSVAYPDGIPPGPMPASPTLGLPVRVFRGWPDAASEDLDLAQGIINVSVIAEKGMSADRTRFDTEWRAAYASPITHLIAQARAADIVVVGRDGDGEDRNVLGAASGPVLMESGRPVLVVPPHIDRLDASRSEDVATGLDERGGLLTELLLDLHGRLDAVGGKENSVVRHAPTCSCQADLPTGQFRFRLHPTPDAEEPCDKLKGSEPSRCAPRYQSSTQMEDGRTS